MAEDSPLISRTQSRSKDLKSDDKKSFAPKVKWVCIIPAVLTLPSITIKYSNSNMILMTQGQLAAVDAENRKRAEAEQQRADVLVPTMPSAGMLISSLISMLFFRQNKSGSAASERTSTTLIRI